MKVTVSFKSIETGERQVKEYNAIKINSDSHFVNITSEDGELYGYPHSCIVSMRVTAQEKENA